MLENTRKERTVGNKGRERKSKTIGDKGHKDRHSSKKVNESKRLLFWVKKNLRTSRL